MSGAPFVEGRGETGAQAWARYGLLLFLLLLIYDGALRKWLLPGSETLLFVAKDALLACLVVYAGTKQGLTTRVRMQPAVRGLLALYMAWVIVEVANPSLPNLFVGLWGMKSHVLYAGLIVLIPTAFGSLRAFFNWFAKAYPWLVVPVCLVTFMQVASPADDVLNQSLRGGLEGTPTFGEERLVRASGTFSYTSGMSAFTQAASQCGLALLVSVTRSVWLVLGLAVTMMALPVTGARAVIVTTAVSLVVMLAAAAAAGVVRRGRAVQVSLVVVALVAVSLATQVETWTALGQRAFSGGEAAEDSTRAMTAFTNAFGYFDVAGVLGFGSGAANLGSPALAPDVTRFSWLPVGDQFEEESGRLVLELGIVGWSISLAMRGAFLLWSWALATKGRTRDARVAGVMALPIMLLGVHVGSGVFAPPVGACAYWFAVSLLGMAEREHRDAVFLDRLHVGMAAASPLPR